MKLDWDCVRAILIATEALDGERDVVAPASLPGFTEDEVVEHIRLLCEAGFIEGFPGGPRPTFARRLTWGGHELLATLRSKELWSQVKLAAKESGLALSFEVVKALASRLIDTLTR